MSASFAELYGRQQSAAAVAIAGRCAPPTPVPAAGAPRDFGDFNESFTMTDSSSGSGSMFVSESVLRAQLYAASTAGGDSKYSPKGRLGYRALVMLVSQIREKLNPDDAGGARFRDYRGFTHKTTIGGQGGETFTVVAIFTSEPVTRAQARAAIAKLGAVAAPDLIDSPHSMHTATRGSFEAWGLAEDYGYKAALPGFDVGAFLADGKPWPAPAAAEAAEPALQRGKR